MVGSSLMVLALSLAGISAQLPDRWTAQVHCNSTWGPILGCGGLPMVAKVYQDVQLNSSYWSQHQARNTLQSHLQEVLITVPSASADPTTPEASQLTRFSWDSGTDFQNCAYQLLTERHDRVPKFFEHPTPVLEKRELVGGVECEKWSNNASRPYNAYWAVWYPVDAQPRHSVVQQAQYITPDSPPHSFPAPGCTQTYTFSSFSTEPIPPERFVPPKDWLKRCINSDGGIQTTGVPGRQDGYVCVSPSKNNSFSVELRTKPVKPVSIQLKACGSQDQCMDGARCKDCVKFSNTAFTFGPDDWSVPQKIEVSYVADGDSQFIFASSDYYLNNTFNTQFSTCACASGKCSNNCQKYCGRTV